MPNHNYNTQAATVDHELAQAEAVNQTSIETDGEAWALALLEECERMDREALLQPQSDAEADGLIFVSSPPVPSSRSEQTAIQKQLISYHADDEARLRDILHEEPNTNLSWRHRLATWFF